MIVWNGDNWIGNIYFKRSIDNGNTFEDTIKLTDSPVAVLPDNLQIGVYKNQDEEYEPTYEPNVYISWIQQNFDKYEVYFKRSIDHGKTFEDTVKLTDIPIKLDNLQIAVYKNNVFLAWRNVHDTFNSNTNNSEIYFMHSFNNGTEFGDIINLSNTPGNVSEFVMTAYDKNLYVAWVDHSNNIDSILFKQSVDNGTSFTNDRDPLTLRNSREGDILKDLKISVNDNSVYVAWKEEIITETFENSVIYFKRSIDNGKTFDKTINLSALPTDDFCRCQPSNPQITAYDDNVYVAWEDNDVHDSNIYFTYSYDNGTTFEQPEMVNHYSQFEIGINDYYPRITAGEDFVFVSWFTEKGFVMYSVGRK